MLKRLKSMPARDFENMSYDLLMLLGVRNLNWRTPGPDTGRDLEGIFLRTDFAGGAIIERWYFECKRYANAIPWPTVYEKISYAANQNADYLLFITTASFSPQCQDEVTNWNFANRLKVRQWPGHHLIEILSNIPKLKVKYNLEKTTKSVTTSILPLSTELAKAVQASYASEEFKGSPTPATEFAAALADLLTACVEDIEASGQLTPRPFRNNTIDGFEWTVIKGVDPQNFDRLTLRAILAAIHLKEPGEHLILTAISNKISISSSAERAIEIPPTLDCTVKEICFWGNVELRSEGGKIDLIRRV